MASQDHFTGLDALRRNRKGEAVSSELGDYTWFNCSAVTASGDHSCGFVGFNVTAGGPVDSPTSYVEGIAMYSVAAAVIAVLVILFCALLVLFRYCCCCCCCACGGRYPTRKRCGCGYSVNDSMSPSYSGLGVWLSRVLLSIFLTLMW